MNNENTDQQNTEINKKKPNTVGSQNVSEAKQKTQPLSHNSPRRQDQDEGKMKNGELGAGLKEEE